jgi:hypothetical protein
MRMSGMRDAEPEFLFAPVKASVKAALYFLLIFPCFPSPKRQL